MCIYSSTKSNLSPLRTETPTFHSDLLTPSLCRKTDKRISKIYSAIYVYENISDLLVLAADYFLSHITNSKIHQNPNTTRNAILYHTMIPATTSKFVFDLCKQDDATQSTLQESDVSLMDLADDDHQQEHHHCREESQETTSVSHKTTERLLEPWKETSLFDCFSCIELSDFSILSNLSMDTALENESPPASHDSDLGLGDEFVELLVSLGNKEHENAVYYMAVILLISKYSTILDMVLAAVIVIYIHR